MAIVVNTGGMDAVLDRPYHTHNRVVAASPNGTATPLYVGEIVFDDTNKVRWRAIGPLSSQWIPLESEVT